MNDSPIAVQRFSDSVIWQQQREYFHKAGSRAWEDTVIPSYITSNAWIARAYAQVVLGYLRDALSQQSGLVHIIDVGAGSGQFAFHFLKQLQQFYADSVINGKISYRYVVTDFTPSNIDFCSQHPAMQDFIDRGLLDFALLDVTRDEPIKLLKSGESLQPGKVPGPVVLIANYLFDSIPQDLFCLQNGQLQACLPKVSAADMSEVDGQVEYDYRPIALDYYSEPHFNALLKYYANLKDLGTTHIPFPVAGLRFLDRIKAMADKGLLLLTADKGFSQKRQLRGREAPRFAKHGADCFSLSVNYHLIDRFIKNHGGYSWLPNWQHRSLCVAGFLLNMSSAIETNQACESMFGYFGPDDFFTLKRNLERNFSTMTLREIFAYIRFSAYDSTAFQRGCRAIKEYSLELKPNDIGEIKALAEKVRANHYDLGHFDLDAEVKSLLKNT